MHALRRLQGPTRRLRGSLGRQLWMVTMAAGLDDHAHDIAAQASAAWEAAVCWDDDYAVRRLAEVRAVPTS